jgi:dTDP-4-dehydrorhamnose reductase
MKILIFGITGMLGHRVFEHFNNYENFSVYGVMRNDKNKYSNIRYFSENKERIFDNFNSYNEKMIENIIKKTKPDYIINCIGIIKQIEYTPIEMININSVFPHILAKFSKKYNSKLIQISTDCVFNGRKGNYKENDATDAFDLYGRSKILGEVTYENNITIRTSIFGDELRNKKSFFEWVISNKNTEIYGYKNAFFSGLSTIEFSRVLGKLMNKDKNKDEISGLLNISVKPISKYELIKIINNKFNLNNKVIPTKNPKIDRSLNNEKAKKIGLIENKNFDKMVDELKKYMNQNSII